mgnify:CR=1 FL=1
MKKLLRTLLLAAALTALLCVSALAADSAVSNVTGNILTPKTAEGAEITADTNGKYENAVKFDVNATGTKGSQYLLLVLRDQNVPTEQNIVYINQAAAGEDGRLVFTGSDAAYPMTMTSGTYYVYLVGDGKEFSASDPAASFTYDAGYTLGDVDGNGRIQALDALCVLKHVANVEMLNATGKLAADVDNNGKIQALDALTILQFVAGVIPKF